MAPSTVTEAQLRDAHERLTAAYGERVWQPRDRSVLDGLVGTLLSQNTSDVNSHRAFQQLKETFPTWEEVRQAPLGDVADAIRSGGLAETKAARIQQILEAIHEERGETDLEHLRQQTNDEIHAYLSRFPGIGPKTVSCVLLFTLGRPDFPVDTHVWRITRRLGWVPEETSREETYEILNGLVPDGIKYSLHVLLIHHGRVCCRSQRPRCEACVLAEGCTFFKGNDGG